MAQSDADRAETLTRSNVDKVESWLTSLGLSVDTDWPEKKASMQTVVQNTLDVVHRLHDADLAGWTRKSSKRGSSVHVQTFGSSEARTVLAMTPELPTTDEDFAVFANDDRMFEVAKIWDTTILSAETVATLALETQRGPSQASTARIVRWKVKVSILTPRELLYAIVPVNNGRGGVCYVYVGLHDDKGPSPGTVRARLLAPSFDDCTPCASSSSAEQDSNKVSFLHAFTCSLGLPKFVQRWVIDAASPAHAVSEAREIVELFQSEAFQAIARRP